MIQLSHVNKLYGNTQVLKDVNLTVHKNDIYGLIGKNGAGKTTIFKIILGLTQYSSGVIQIDNSNSNKEILKNRKKIGFFIGHNFFDYLNAYDNLKYYCTLNMVIFIVLAIMAVYIKSGPNYTSENYLSDMQTLIRLYPLLIGLSIFITVFHDDFKAKTIQVALGSGLSKNKIVLVKMIDVVLLSLLAGIISTLILSLLPLLFQININAMQYRTIATAFLVQTVLVIGYIMLCMPILFYRSNALEGVILYVLLASRVISIFINMLITSKMVVSVIGQQDRFLLFNALIELQMAVVAKQQIAIEQLIIIVMYIVIPLVLALVLFKDKELEF